MANDPFDTLISTNMSPALAIGAGMAANARRDREVSAERSAQRDQNMLQFMLERSSQDRADRESARRFDLQLSSADRAYGLQREESAFARLNASLDRQLQAAELDAKDRQQAFDNSLRAMSVALDTKIKGMQLKQFESQAEIPDFLAEWDAAVARLGGSGDLDAKPLEVSRVLRGLMSKYKGGYGLLATTNPELKDKMLFQLQGISQLKSDTFDLRPGRLGDKLNVGELEKELSGRGESLLDFAGRDINDTQVLGFLASQAKSRNPEAYQKDPAGALAGYLESLSAGESESPYAVMAQKLKKDSSAQLHVRDLDRSGLLDPVRSVEQLQALREAEMDYVNTKAALRAKSPAGVFSKEFEEGFRELDRRYAYKVAEIKSGGNPNARRVLDGEFLSANDVVEALIQDADFQRSGSDMWDATGVPDLVGSVYDSARGGKTSVRRGISGYLRTVSKSAGPALSAVGQPLFGKLASIGTEKAAEFVGGEDFSADYRALREAGNNLEELNSAVRLTQDPVEREVLVEKALTLHDELEKVAAYYYRGGKLSPTAENLLRKRRLFSPEFGFELQNAALRAKRMSPMRSLDELLGGSSSTVPVDSSTAGRAVPGATPGMVYDESK